ncbi:acetylxylan esterase [Candidatus Woesearchaeota archaeon]|nr:acetylxylan esterase [Candidatus Woesearchaeota archaeon]
MKIKKRYVYAGLILLIILIAAIFIYKPIKSTTVKKEIPKEEFSWTVDNNGYLHYPLERGKVKFNRQTYAETDNLSISKIIYQSKEKNIYGFLVLPKFTTNLLPAVVLLPGAGVSKEAELNLAKKIAELGIVVLTIDQRGVGETNGNPSSLDRDFQSFLSSKEPYQYLMVYDALRAFDLLYSTPFIDSDRIIITGESLGGRIAVIATAIDNNIKGVLIISSAGLNFKPKGDIKKDIFLQSIDSDHYISLITPRKIVMVHNINDINVPLSSAVNSFTKAQEPKRFALVNDTICNHGYCDSMYNSLVESLNFLLS